VRITADLGIARVYISIIGSEEQRAEVMEHLHAENKTIRKTLSSKIRHQFRRIPELEFYEDRLFEQANRIEQLLKSVKPARNEEQP
jgi:ribosome-binding factor A